MKTPTILILATAAVMLGQQTTPPPPPPTDIAGMDDGAVPDEPGRAVARLSVASGEVSVRRGDDTSEWVAAALNAPLMEGDSVSVARQAAAEVQFDNAHFARMAGDTEMRINSMDGGHHGIQLARGLVTWRVLRESQGGAEISTPMAAVRPLGMAAVRIEVGIDATTRVTVRHGEAEVQSARGVERVREGQSISIGASGDYQILAAASPDRWDTWSDQRDAYLMRAASPRYVSQDVYGTEDMDPYGRWDHDPAYGDVWTPSVPAGWAPYRDGRWVWEDYYGWTWVDNQPWGWAPFHYGNWYMRVGYGWSWYPGARAARYWWRPAMVGFFGYGGGFGVGVGFGNVGWVPLAPYERYRPWYGRGWNGGRNVVNNVNITNVYRNARFGNGATAVSSFDFQRGNYRNRIAVDAGHLQQASLVRGAGMAPTQDHLRFSDRSVGIGGPRTDLGNRSFFTGNAAGVNRGSGAGVARVPFSQQQAQVRTALESVRQNGGAGRQFGGSPAGAAGQARPGGEVSPGWQRFGSPQQERQAQGNAVRQEAPAAQPQVFGGQRFGNTQGQVDMTQPVVRQRESQPQTPGPQAGPRYDRSFGNPGNRTAPAPPQQQAPAPQQYRSAPPQQQQTPAPQYRPAPQQQHQQAAPQQFRAAPEHSNGGGGGQKGNGGNSGAGGGGHRGR